MKNVRTVLALMASVFFLSHCGNGNEVATIEVMDLGGNECIAGVYKGEADLRWNASLDQDVAVSIAFQGSSALVKVQGEDGDLLCTHYEGLEVTGVEDEDGVSVLSAARVTHSRTIGTSSDALADGLLNIQVDLSDEDAPCNFKIGSTDIDPSWSLFNDGMEDDTIESSQLEKQADQADFNTLVTECGGQENFVELPQEEEETEEEATE